MTDERLVLQLSPRSKISSKGNLRHTILMIELSTVASTTIVIWRTYGLRRVIRYLTGLTTALATQRAFLSAMIRKIGPEQSSLADGLTLCRAATGGVLAGLVTSGICDRKGIAGWTGWLMPLLGVTDWLDGSIARHVGSTRLGGVLDIEADSWLTLWCAAGAVAWGDLPRWCLLSPIIHYLDPLLALLQGKLPQGGGPWWSRIAGASQMGLLLVALAPIDWRQRKQMLTAASLPVISGQCTAIVVLLVRKLREG